MISKLSYTLRSLLRPSYALRAAAIAIYVNQDICHAGVERLYQPPVAAALHRSLSVLAAERAAAADVTAATNASKTRCIPHTWAWDRSCTFMHLISYFQFCQIL